MVRKTHFDRFGDHTLVKHYLLDVYLKAWATILLPRFKQLWFVDAFAGEGCDAEGNPGSPLIAARIAEEINSRHFPEGLTAKTGMRVAAFENIPERYASLVAVMAPFTEPARPWPKTIAIVREGTLDARLDKMLPSLHDVPVLYFLDPFGIDGLTAAILPQLLDGPRKELLVLFADEGAVRLAGKVRAGIQNESATIEAAAAAVPASLFGDEDTDLARQDAISAAKRSLAGHKSNPNAEEIMDRAFGGNWWRPIIDATRDDQRQAKFVELYEGLLQRSGATKRLHFSVNTADGRHKYFLIHASTHKAAFTAMKDTMHRTRNKTTVATGFLQEAETENDIRGIADAIAMNFAGRQVRWTGAPGSVQDFALQETPLWQHEFDALKAELRRRRFTDVNEKGNPKIPLSFTFPPDPAPTA